MRARRLRRLPQVAAALLAAGLAACGSDPAAPSVVTPPSPSSSGPAGNLNMALLSQVDLRTLAQAPAAVGADPMPVPAGVTAAGNWGYTTADGRRFALTGTSAGLSIVEVTDPARPRAVALVPGPPSAWREVRTFGEYAYVTTEAAWGLDIVSLRDPDRPRKVQTWNRTIRTAHSLWIDVDRGLLFANGVNGARGGMRILDIATNPEEPVEVGAFTEFYIHDSYSRGNVLFASAISDGFQALIDVSDPSRPREITRFLTGGRFTHNSWVTRDGRYLFTTDERTGQPVEGWDISVPTAPRKVSQFIANPAAIAHNVMIDGDRLLVAHYTEGVYLLDILNPEQPRVIGSYDTFPGPSGGFNGAWGAYIFPESNLVVASDIQGGLFVLAYTGP
ncbi:MAG TPA: choice-of-anchor B family protein [Vicinamibacteria bacterium]|nr:choice-of-anchor B family protein [Vicinamibacteria bacterium]